MLNMINYLFKLFFTVSLLSSGDRRQSRLAPVGAPWLGACDCSCCWTTSPASTVAVNANSVGKASAFRRRRVAFPGDRPTYPWYLAYRSSSNASAVKCAGHSLLSCCVSSDSEWTAPGEYCSATSSIIAAVWSEGNGKSILFHSIPHPDSRFYGGIQIPNVLRTNNATNVNENW